MYDKENELQMQYGYSHGIVLVIDPFSIKCVFDEYEDQLSDVDKANISAADTTDLLLGFITKLKAVAQINPAERANVPLAIVINKIDSADLGLRLGARGVLRYKELNPDSTINDLEITNMLCRKFFEDYKLNNFLNNIELNFSNYRFFSCSAMGHEKDAGKYRPSGVMDSIYWIIKQADRKLGSTWKS